MGKQSFDRTHMAIYLRALTERYGEGAATELLAALCASDEDVLWLAARQKGAGRPRLMAALARGAAKGGE